jgi:hypothetical protein
MLLLLWSVVDCFFGVLCLVGSFVSLIDPAPAKLAYVVPFLVIGTTLVPMGILAITCSVQLFRNRGEALRTALWATHVSEVGAYAFIGVYLFWAWVEQAWTDHDRLVSFAIGLAIYLVIPVAVTLTRVLLVGTRRRDATIG